MRAGLGEGWQTAVAGFADLIQRVFTGEMHDVDGHAGDLGHGDGAVDGLSLGARGTGKRVVDGRLLAFGQGLLHDHINYGPVFGMHADERAVFRGLLHGLEDGGVIDHEHVGIGHEELEAGDTFADEVVHVFEAGVGQVGDDHVQAVVDAGLALGLLPPGVERGAHLCSARLYGEVDDGGGAADGGGACAGEEVVGRRSATEGHVEVGVRVDAAGQKQQAGGIDNGAGCCRGDTGTNFLNHCAVDEYVGLRGGICVDDGAVSDEE